jgi:hypothetical protein
MKHPGFAALILAVATAAAPAKADMPTGCDACTSVATYGANHDLIVLTTGNLLEGGDAPARVLRLPSPVQ